MRAALIAAALLVAACSGADTSESSSESPEETTSSTVGDVETTPVPDASEPSDVSESSDVSDSEPSDASDASVVPGDERADDDESAESASSGDVDDAERLPETPAPIRGGTLRVLLDAETDTWDIPNANCASACMTVMQQVADPLLVVAENGELEPFLLRSIDVSDDLTTWTLTMRDGVVFHDGTPADGAALRRHLVEFSAGLVQSQAYRTLRGGPGSDDGITLVDEMTVEVVFDEPNASFGDQLSVWSGWLMAPSFWDDDEPAALPVGTGPFVMTSWQRNEMTELAANADYWRAAADGEALPYLDAVQIRPIPDVSTRRAVMEAGDADVNVDSFPENRAFWLDDWVAAGNQLAPVSPARDVEYLLLNSSRAPMDDRAFRRALAACTDREEYQAFRAPGTELAFGPFASGAPGFTDDVDLPVFDPAAASAQLDRLGRPDELAIGVTNVPAQQLTVELIADQWSRHCGLNVSVTVFEQSEFITRALLADYDILLWRNHGMGSPAMETVWWHSRHTEGLATNFGRIVDADLDALLDQLSATTDLAEVDAIGQQIQRLFADEMYNVWLNTGEWAIPVADGVAGVGDLSLFSGLGPNGAVGGRLWLHEAWLSE